MRFKSHSGEAARQAAHENAGAVRLRQYSYVEGLQLIKTDAGGVGSALAAYRKNSNVLYAEPDYVAHIACKPTDPRFHRLWGLYNTGQRVNGFAGSVRSDIHALEAWKFETGDPDLRIAVIDTGVDYNHPDLAANIWINPAEIPGNGIDDDGNGWIDDIHGIDVVNQDGDPMDDNAHGSHVSGTIGAVPNNNEGVVGVVWQCKIVALKIFSASGHGFSSDILPALEYVVANGIRISNNSYVIGEFSQAIYDAVQATQSIGHIFVAAASNDGSDSDIDPVYPAAFDLPNVISVAATDIGDNLAGFSNYGLTTVDLGAPGVNILSTVPGSGYAYFNGTSMATPHVTGVVALVLSSNPTWTVEQVKARIMQGVRPVESLAGLTVTGGVVSAMNFGDCNDNGVADSEDIAAGTSQDCTGNGIPDECEADCNCNGAADSCDVFIGVSPDCNANLIPDECEDCNENGVADSCDINAGTSPDCNGNLIPDECEDCNANGVADSCDINAGTSPDCTGNGVPDECDLASCQSDPGCDDCNQNKTPDVCDIADGASDDCNGNAVPDECDLVNGTSEDCGGNGLPDECEPDCNANGVPDECDLVTGFSEDCNNNGVPDECDKCTVVVECDATDEIVVSSDPEPYGIMGAFVSISGNVVVLGGKSDGLSGPDTGSATIFRYNLFTEAWEEEQKITPLDGSHAHPTGISVSISGDTIVLGFPFHDAGGGYRSGSAYVFRFKPDYRVWEQAQKLTAADPSEKAFFGESVSLSGDVLLVGARGNDNQNSAYVFRYNAESQAWEQELKLSSAEEGFGFAVSVNADLTIIGAPGDEGSAWIYRYDPNSKAWALEQVLAAAESQLSGFGDAVAINGNVAIVGNRWDDTQHNNSGAAYIFRYDPATGIWAQEQKLTATSPTGGGGFGFSVAIEGEFAIVGSPSEPPACLFCSTLTAAYVFRYDAHGGQWIQKRRLVLNAHSSWDSRVALSGGVAVGTVPGEDVDDPFTGINLTDAGSARIFTVLGQDCNLNGSADVCDIAEARSTDCDGNEVPDECEIDHDSVAGGGPFFCTSSGDLDCFCVADCDADCNANGIPDSCDNDCNCNGLDDALENDCNCNNNDDTDDIAALTSQDCNGNGVPDECEISEQSTAPGGPFFCAAGCAPDCNANGIPDSCDIESGADGDCDGSGIPDQCELFLDCNVNGVRDTCDVAADPSIDCNVNWIPDECEPDQDCNGNGIRDICDIGNGTSTDCNRNNVPDACDIESGASADEVGDGVPDECSLEPYIYWSSFDDVNSLGFNGIKRARLDGSNKESLVNFGLVPTALVVDPVEGKMYWVTRHLIRRANLDGSDQETVISNQNAAPALALDAATQSLYWFHGRVLRRANVDGSSIVDVAVLAVEKPSDMVIDPLGGHVYWSETSRGLILRARVDGSEIESLLSVHAPNGLAIDHCAAKLYWIGNGLVQRSNLDGTTIQPLHDVLDGTEITLDVAGGKMYWSRSTVNNGDIYMANLDGSEFATFPMNVWTHPTDVLIARQVVTDCNGNAVLDVCEVTLGNSLDCNRNSRPDECDLALFDCNSNGQPDSCDISDGTLSDLNNDGFADECCSVIGPPMPVAIPDAIGGSQTLIANRFLMFTLDEPGRRRAVRVTFDDLPAPFDKWNGAQLWVGPTESVSEIGGSITPVPGSESFSAATLQCDAWFTDWIAVGNVHVFHEGIVPGGRYRIEVIDEACDPVDASSFSEPFVVDAAKWGDTLKDLSTDPPGPPDGLNNIVDALGIIQRFASQEGSILKPRADLEPGCLDLKINITDVLAAITGFQGLGYPFEPTADDPCDSTCINPLP